MSSDKQIAANRRNAKKSTGPKTSSGKARSAMNALKSGLHAKSLVLPTERAADLYLLTAEYYDQFRPATAELRDLVDEFITLVWQLRRLGVTEVQLYNHEQDSFWQPDKVQHPQGQIASNCYRAFAALQRRLDSTRRSRDRVRDSIHRLRAEQTDQVGEAAQPPATPEPAAVPSHTPAITAPSSPKRVARPAPTPSPAATSPQIGFVPSPSAEPSSTPANPAQNPLQEPDQAA